MKTVSPHEAVAALRAGKVALVPTETVVGLVAAEPGLPRIREIKGRDANKPIALLCTSVEEAFGLAANVPPLARDLAQLYWPGPLTLVLDLPSGGTIGVRVPAGKAVRALLEAYGAPLYATSANLSGGPAGARSRRHRRQRRKGDRRSLSGGRPFGRKRAASTRCQGPVRTATGPARVRMKVARVVLPTLQAVA